MSISIVDDRPVQESGAGDEYGGVVRIADIRYVPLLSPPNIPEDWMAEG
jgi:hypothetical protein